MFIKNSLRSKYQFFSWNQWHRKVT